MIPRENEIIEPRHSGGYSSEFSGRISPEIALPFSSPFGRDALTSGQMDPAARRIGDHLMLRTGTLEFNNVLPREGTLDFLHDSIKQAEAAEINKMAAMWMAQNPGQPLPRELAALLRTLNPDGTVGGGDPISGEEADGGGRRRSGSGRRQRSRGDSRSGGDGHSSRSKGRRRAAAGDEEEEKGDEGASDTTPTFEKRKGGKPRAPSAEPQEKTPGRRGAEPGARDAGEPRAARGPERTADDRPASGALQGNTRAEKIFNFLIEDIGLTKAQAAGVLGNFIQETASLDPKQPGDGGAAIGIAQWNGPRKRALFSFARESGESATELGTQLKFLKHELLTSERGAFAALKRTSTPEAAAMSFSRLFERPGNPMNGQRVANARMAFSRYGRGEDIQVASR